MNLRRNYKWAKIFAVKNHEEGCVKLSEEEQEELLKDLIPPPLELPGDDDIDKMFPANTDFDENVYVAKERRAAAKFLRNEIVRNYNG